MRPKSAWLRLIVIGSPSSNGYSGLYITYNNSNLAIVLKLELSLRVRLRRNA
jgi:hypothetical protein